VYVLSPPLSVAEATPKIQLSKTLTFVKQSRKEILLSPYSHFAQPAHPPSWHLSVHPLALVFFLISMPLHSGKIPPTPEVVQA
jgi:hypothetical protein